MNNPHPAPLPCDASHWLMRLRDSRLRATREVLRTLCVLERCAAPMSHDDIMQALRNDAHSDIHRVTLYRLLQRLSQAQLVHKVCGNDRVWRFSLLPAHKTGAYFECQQCHQVAALPPDPALPALLQRVRERLEQDGISGAVDMALTVHGRCGHCA